MNIVLFYNGYVPAIKYGGTERVVFYLAQELEKLGHTVTLLVKGTLKETVLKTIIYNESIPIKDQLPSNTDVVHLHSLIEEQLDFPYVITLHGNTNNQNALDENVIFVSKNHAERHGSSSYVLNGLNWDDYSVVNMNEKRRYYHFLGNAAWKVKNVTAAIELAKKSNEKIKILGGVRFNFNMGIRFTFTHKASFYGMVGGDQKDALLNASKGLIFPVLWHEPFGLAIIESLYFGAPVFGTPYGALPELVTPEVGYLSDDKSVLVEAIESNHFDRKLCHEYARDLFNSKRMAEQYLLKYETVLNHNSLNKTAPFLQALPTSKYLKF
mgnify:FL=1